MNETLTMLIDQLHNPDRNARIEAALTLGKLKDPRALDALIQAMCSEPDFFVGEDLTWALVRLGDAAVAPLLDLLRDNSPVIRHQAAHTLGKIGDQRAVAGLLRALQDPDVLVVSKAAFALGQIGDITVIPALLQLLGHEQREVQTTVNTVLEQFGDAALQPVIAALRHEQWQIREQAADILGLMDNPLAAAPLLVALQDGHWAVRFAAATALGGIGGAEAVSALDNLKNDPDPRVRGLVVKLTARPKR